MSPDSALDVAVVGAGPAGLATAIACRRRGLRVAVFDRAEPPLDKACGEGLMPDAVTWLEDHDVRLSRAHPFVGIRYVDGALTADGSFPGPPGLGVRRVVLSDALVRRARELDVGLHFEHPVRALLPGGIDTDRGPFDAGTTVLADGLRSPFRDAIDGNVRRTRGARRFGLRRHFACAPWCDRVEVHWGDGCEAYVTPVAADEVGIAFLWRSDRVRDHGFDALLARFPTLAERIGDAKPRSRVRGAGPLRQRVRRVVRGRRALVGDAAGYVDAITGEGLSVAFQQASALADAIAADRLDGYARAHRRIGRWPNAITALLLHVEPHTALRRRAIAALAERPELFDRLLAVHARAEPPRALGATPLRLLAGIVRASTRPSGVERGA